MILAFCKKLKIKPVLCLYAERVGIAQPREEKAAGRTYCGPFKGLVREMGTNFLAACCDRTRCNGFELKEGRFRLVIRKKCFPLRVVRP